MPAPNSLLIRALRSRTRYGETNPIALARFTSDSSSIACVSADENGETKPILRGLGGRKVTIVLQSTYRYLLLAGSMSEMPVGLTCLFVALALLLSGCSADSRAVTTPPADPLPTVAVARVSTETVSRDLTLTGEFRPYLAIDLHAKVAGYLKTIAVDAGDHVAAGQVIATLEIPEMNDDLNRAAAERRRSDAELMRAKGDLERAEANRTLIDVSHKRLTAVNAKEPGLVAQQEIDESLARKRTAEAQVAAAKAALAAAEQQIEAAKASEQHTKTMADYSRIVAPFAGMITKRFADPGAMIQAGTNSHSQAMPVVRLAQIDRLRLVVPVPESASGQVRPGAPVLIRVTSLGKTMPGTVSRLTGDVQLSTRTMDVEIDVRNPGGILLPGMYADAVLTLERRQNTTTLPVQALVLRDGKRIAMVVNHGRVEEREIRTGIETASKVEVVSGLEPDDLVVIGSKSQLKPGQKVEPKITGIG